jgi:hypothetical protein
MTAEELIAQLEKLPPETPVLTPEQIVRYRHAQEWDGEYQTLDRFSNTETERLKAVVIHGRRGHRR